jgi:hypothetical protein
MLLNIGDGITKTSEGDQSIVCRKGGIRVRMRQKEIYKLAAGVLACSMLLGGCGDTADEPVPSDTEVSAPVDVSTTTTHFDKWTPSAAQDEPTTLIWLTATEESDAVVQQCDYFNQLLLEKGLPYQVEFIYAGSGDTFSKLQ